MSARLLGLVLVLAGTVWAEHTPRLSWMKGYTDYHGTSCCGVHDCRVAVIALLPGTQGDDEHQALTIDGHVLMLPRQSVHQSETSQAYWCYRDPEGGITARNTRCAFYTLGL